MSKEELTALKKEMLLNILSAEKSIFIHYKNKQLTKDKKNRSEERRVGKECRSRWSTKHKNKKK